MTGLLICLANKRRRWINTSRRILNLKHISKPVRTYSIRQERHQTEAARSAHIPFRPSGKGTETAPTVNTSIGIGRPVM